MSSSHSQSQNAPDEAASPEQFSLIDYLNELVGVPPNIHPKWVGFVNNIWSHLRLAVLNRCDTFGFNPNDGLCYFKIKKGKSRLVGNNKFLIGMENYPELQKVFRQCIEQTPQLSPFLRLSMLTEDTVLYIIELNKIPPPASKLELLLDTLNYVGIDRNYKRVEKLAHLTEKRVFEQILAVLETVLPTSQTDAGLPENVTINSSQRPKAARAIIKSYLLLQSLTAYLM